MFHFRCLNARGRLFTVQKKWCCSTYSLTLRIVPCGVGGSALEPGARGSLGGPRQCLRVDILPDVRQFAILNGNSEDPMVLERLIRGFIRILPPFDHPTSFQAAENAGDAAFGDKRPVPRYSLRGQISTVICEGDCLVL